MASRSNGLLVLSVTVFFGNDFDGHFCNVFLIKSVTEMTFLSYIKFV
jgi:hypothetical protein